MSTRLFPSTIKHVTGSPAVQKKKKSLAFFSDRMIFCLKPLRVIVDFRFFWRLRVAPILMTTC